MALCVQRGTLDRWDGATAYGPDALASWSDVTVFSGREPFGGRWTIAANSGSGSNPARGVARPVGLEAPAALDPVPLRQVGLDQHPLRALPERLGADCHHRGLNRLGAAPECGSPLRASRACSSRWRTRSRSTSAQSSYHPGSRSSASQPQGRTPRSSRGGRPIRRAAHGRPGAGRSARRPATQGRAGRWRSDQCRPAWSRHSAERGSRRHAGRRRPATGRRRRSDARRAAVQRQEDQQTLAALGHAESSHLRNQWATEQVQDRSIG